MDMDNFLSHGQPHEWRHCSWEGGGSWERAGNAGTAEESAAGDTDEEHRHPHSDPNRCLLPDIWAAVGLAVGCEEAEHIHILGVTDVCSAGLAPVCVCAAVTVAG